MIRWRPDGAKTVHYKGCSLIDLHCHILPGLDDGPSSMDESIEMCRIAASDGIKLIAATPHGFNGDFNTEPRVIRSAVDNLNLVLRRLNIDIAVVPGMEIRIVPNLPQLLAQDKAIPLGNSRYILLEFDPANIPAGFDNLVLMLRRDGWKIIISHPEKNMAVQENPKYMVNLVKRFEPWDLLLQLSADSLIGDAGRYSYRTAATLLRENAAHIIASDAHSSKMRRPELRKAVHAAAGIIGEGITRQMVQDVPEAVLTGTGFPYMWQGECRKSWWRSFFGLRQIS